MNKIHLKCDANDGFVVNSFRQLLLCKLLLYKPPGYKVFCEPETVH